MIEIKSISGQVLYTAKNANSVRLAVEKAVANGANLNGANLGGANLGGGTWQKIATVLADSLQAMNDGGKHWIKGALHEYLEDGSDAYCSIGSIESRSDDGTIITLAKWLLSSVCAGRIDSMNDHADTTWEDIQLFFKAAIRNAERLAS